MKKNDLVFFTESYPYGYGETFIENELNFIASYFKTVYLFHKSKADTKREVPANVKLVFIEASHEQFKNNGLKKNWFLFLYLTFHELFFSRQKKMFIQNLKYNLNHILNCINYSNQIKSNLNQEILNNACFYSYWFFDWNFSLSILKFKHIIKKNCTRAHGFDVYENNGKPNYLPSRKFCLKQTDSVFVISKKGETYLKTLYPNFKNKISCSYLGTVDNGINPINQDKKRIHIVSCSNVIDVKRIHLIIETLKHMQVPVLWTHFGDGKLMQLIQQQATDLPENIEVDFRGSVTQQEIFEFYKNIPIDVFMNCSLSEGLPVSIMEAISFGIPVIATNVGGTSEIVNEKTGLLIDKYFEPKAVAKLILKLYYSESYIKLRIDAKDFWKNNFCGERNYLQFVKHII